MSHLSGTAWYTGKRTRQTPPTVTIVNGPDEGTLRFTGVLYPVFHLNGRSYGSIGNGSYYLLGDAVCDTPADCAFTLEVKT